MGNKQDMNASKQSLNDKLMAIILLETSKDYKEMDSDLVTECVDFLMELEGKERLTKKEIEQRVNEIPFKGKATAIGSYAKKKIRAKRLAVIAAVLAVLIAVFIIFSIASGDAYVDLFSRIGNSLFDMLDKGAINFDNITLIKADSTKEYSSIEDLAKDENIKILYPAWLPENEKIATVWCLTDNGKKTLVLQRDNPEQAIHISIDAKIPEKLKLNCEEKEINGYTVYLSSKNSTWQVDFEYMNCHYSIGADTKDNLFKILENLEEIN